MSLLFTQCYENYLLGASLPFVFDCSDLAEQNSILGSSVGSKTSFFLCVYAQHHKVQKQPQQIFHALIWRMSDLCVGVAGNRNITCKKILQKCDLEGLWSPMRIPTLGWVERLERCLSLASRWILASVRKPSLDLFMSACCWEEQLVRHGATSHAMHRVL